MAAERGIATTLEALSKTKNEAAVGILIPALDSPDPSIQLGALRALLARHSQTGHREIVRRLHTVDARWRDVLADQQGRMTNALRDAVLATSPQLCANGCQGVLWFREFDLMPALVNACEDEANPNRNLVAQTLLELAELLYEELAAPRNYRNRRDPQLVRQHVLGSLEQSVRRFVRHRRMEIIEAFMLLVGRDNVTLKQILMDPLDGSYLAVIDCLTHSERSGVLRLVLGFLDDPHAPSAAISLLSRRSDPKFIEYLLKKIGFEPSNAAAANLKRIESIAWLNTDPAVLDRLDDAAQHAAVQLAARSGMNRAAVFKMLEHMILRGKAGGRRAAAQALSQFNGSEANALTLRALQDPDPQVQAHALRQLRPRGIPGALGRLIEAIDSPQVLVSQAARDSLAEFSFRRFLISFDLLSEEVRRSTGAMVRKIDPLAKQQLAEELATRSRTRRLRALAMIQTMDIARELEAEITEKLSDEDHLVRSEAVRALGYCDTPTARLLVQAALNDRSVVVQESAEVSLRRLGSRLPGATFGSGQQPQDTNHEFLV